MLDVSARPTAPAAPAATHPATAVWTAGIARGDRAAFEAFYDAWFARAFALARRTLRGDREGAHDVVQDVMLRVARSMPALADERAVEAWMARTVFHAAIDRLRAGLRRARHESNAVAGRDDTHPDTHSVAELREAATWLAAQIASLPDADREALALRFDGDVTLEEVGARLGITGHAAHGRIRRALLRLKARAAEVFR